MDQSKFNAFIAAVTKMTKAKDLSWKRIDTTIFTHKSWAKYDLNRSFICSYLSGRIILAITKDTGIPHCFVSPESSVSFQRTFGPDADESAALVLRLYNLVYSTFPSVDSFMDVVIASANSLDVPPDLDERSNSDELTDSEEELPF